MENLQNKLKSFIKKITWADIFGLISISVTVFVIYYVLISQAYKLGFYSVGVDNLTEKIDIASKNTLETTQMLKTLNNDIDTIISIARNPNIVEKINIIKINRSIDSLKLSVNKIEKIIIQDTDKALEIPMLKKDIENIKERNALEIDLLKSHIDNYNNFMLATLGVLAIGTLANALINIGKREEKKLTRGLDDLNRS